MIAGWLPGGQQTARAVCAARVSAPWIASLAVLGAVAVVSPRRAAADRARPVVATPTVRKAASVRVGRASSITPRPPRKPARPAMTTLASMTRDPALGRADRVDGHGFPGLIAFTFDDGPNPETTPAILDALAKYDVPGAFFIVTSRLVSERARALVRRELEAGYLVGSHTVGHKNLKRTRGAAALAREIDASIRTLATTTGQPIALFRPPYGMLSSAGRARLKRLGLTEVRWSLDTRDWDAEDPAELRANILAMIKTKGGGVVLMHDIKPLTAEIIGQVFDDLEAENCARLAERRAPIIPVSLHYFLRNGKQPRPVPPAVRKRTAAYREALAERCAKRPAPEAAPADPMPPEQPPTVVIDIMNEPH